MVGWSGTSRPRLEYSTKIFPSAVSGLQIAEHLAATAMKETGNGPENFPMRALARARRAKHQNRSVLHASCDSISCQNGSCHRAGMTWIGGLLDDASSKIIQ
jgi:hypothetical protein